MIVGFRNRETETIWAGRRSQRLPLEIQDVALRKLRLLNNARRLDVCGSRRATGSKP
jgi:proteic killer suppression protein